MADETEPDLAAISFLLVEDVPMHLALVETLLRSMGATNIAAASNGVEALVHLDSAETQPDLMIVDLAMPEMGGVQLMNNLAERSYSGAVLVLSGADQLTLDVAQGMAEYRGINFLGCVTKPITRQAMTEMLGHLAGPAT